MTQFCEFRLEVQLSQERLKCLQIRINFEEEFFRCCQYFAVKYLETYYQKFIFFEKYILKQK